MTVNELIQELSKFPDDMHVCIHHSDLNNFGASDEVITGIEIKMSQKTGKLFVVLTSY